MPPERNVINIRDSRSKIGESLKTIENLCITAEMDSRGNPNESYFERNQENCRRFATQLPTVNLMPSRVPSLSAFLRK